MAILHERQFPLIIENLRARLKAQGLRQQDIADRLGVGLATVKRWLGGNGINTDNLEDLCDLAQVELFEVVESIGSSASRKTDRFTPSQERAFGENRRLFFAFLSLLNGWPIEDCKRELRIPDDEMECHIRQLERLSLLDILPHGRVRMLADRSIAWRRDGPIAKYMAATPDFFDLDNSENLALHMGEACRLTDEGRARIKELMEELRREIYRIAHADRHKPEASRSWQGLIFEVRPINMEALRYWMSDGT